MSDVKKMWLCRAAWYLGDDAQICEAATISRTGHEIGKIWGPEVHSRCGYVGIVEWLDIEYGKVIYGEDRE